MWGSRPWDAHQVTASVRLPTLLAAQQQPKGREACPAARALAKSGGQRAGAGATHGDCVFKLSEIRKKGTGCMGLEDALPHVCAFAKDKGGCRFLLEKLPGASEASRSSIVVDLLTELPDLAADKEGSAVVCRLFELGTQEQRRLLASSLVVAALTLSKDRCGCRVVQLALELAPREEKERLARALATHVPECVECMHANHVLQKLVEQLPPDSADFVVEELRGRVAATARHVYGCRVIQRLLEHGSAASVALLAEELLARVPELARDQYGCTVLRHLLEHGSHESKARLFRALSGADALGFARHKFASLVVEQCLTAATTGAHAVPCLREELARFADRLLESRLKEAPIMELVGDRYGNFVIQRFVQCPLPSPQRAQLRAFLSSVGPRLRSTSGGRRVLANAAAACA
jgi:mRNA-binding protein PUF3